MPRVVLDDCDGSFEVTVAQALAPQRVVLFAVGGGGDPDRHLPLLTTLSALGCTVVAPHFERLLTPRASAADLLLRARRLRIALNRAGDPDLPVAGVGHSIGATMLLALAGGQVWIGPGEALPAVPEPRLERLALLAPATGFFQAPGALDRVHIPITVWAGAKDVVTPPAQAAFLKQALSARTAVELRVIDDAGHFSFMHAPPPYAEETLSDRAGFLANLTDEIASVIA